MHTRWARFARGWIVAAFSTFVAALSHTLGGGSAPSLLVVVVSLAFAGMVCVALAGRTLSFWRGAVSVLVSQIIFHGLFSLGATGGMLGADAIAAAATHQHAALPGLIDPMVMGATAHVPHDGAAMWLAHFGAAIVTILALRFAERAFWSLVENVRLGIRTLFVPAQLAVPVAAPQRIGNVAPVLTPRDLVLVLSAMRHRGPPVFALAA
ncbi:hypothetical protein [Cryobacterium sp. TMS1-13-1]|uniref:hypothetical protein n=1 Tax=Cryobacterium sp. TMS1-13-1 TaxID=1259220 RepID=UPI00106B4AA5|nr:hypothetical protein [Cryobacterium sp. TMS1-13-1]TFD24948.1 hypothetical protein E3T31_01490 [Cryobacterium sp. TMS1-13-1]